MSLSTMAAARQNEIKASMAVVAISTRCAPVAAATFVRDCLAGWFCIDGFSISRLDLSSFERFSQVNYGDSGKRKESLCEGTPLKSYKEVIRILFVRVTILAGSRLGNPPPAHRQSFPRSNSCTKHTLRWLLSRGTSTRNPPKPDFSQAHASC